MSAQVPPDACGESSSSSLLQRSHPAEGHASYLTAWPETPGGDVASPQAQSSPSSSSSRVSEPPSKPPRRRIRPKIDLAPGQPPTARGNDRIRVHVACYQCRARKIRCDGGKPTCVNCQRRLSANDRCNYDSGPKRRGREKGSTSKGKGSRRRLLDTAQTQSESDASLEIDERIVKTQHAAAHTQADFSSHIDTVQSLLEPALFESREESTSWDLDFMLDAIVPQTYISHSTDSSESYLIFASLDQEGREEEQNMDIPSIPSTQFARDTWWDALLTFYATDFTPPEDLHAVSLTCDQRNTAMKNIVQDLRTLLQASPCWLGFFDLSRFFDTLFDPTRRKSLQPSFLLSALALGKLAKGSEVEEGAQGRKTALTLLQMAHGALEGSLATGWVDVGLAHASMLILYFEMHSHPMQTLQRTRSALLLLDSLLRLFSLTTIDEGIKQRGCSPYSALTSPFSPSMSSNFAMPPSAHYGLQRHAYTPDVNTFAGAPFSTTSDDLQSHTCKCASMSLGHKWPTVKTIAPAWASTVMWPEGLPEAEYRREECRRFVWSCVMMVAAMNAYTSGVPGSGVPLGRVIVREPENFAVLLPGESLALAGGLVIEDDMCTLNLRSMLLMHLVMRVREDEHLSPAERAQMGIQAWLEIDDLEARFARHSCDLHMTFGYEGKEMLFMLRMLTSYEFQNFIPQVSTMGNRLFYRDKAETWLKEVDRVGGWVEESVTIGTLSPSQDHRKSLLVFWQIATIRRALVLWEGDKGLIFALTLACKFASHVEYGMVLWPGNLRLQGVWQTVRYNLVNACLQAGIPPPSPALPRIPTRNTPVPDSAQSHSIPTPI